MSEFYPLGMSCTKCGKQLEARYVPTSAVQVAGLLSLEYRHTDGTTECVVRHEPRPCDEWKASAAFDKARRQAWAAEDALTEKC